MRIGKGCQRHPDPDFLILQNTSRWELEVGGV